MDEMFKNAKLKDLKAANNEDFLDNAFRNFSVKKKKNAFKRFVPAAALLLILAAGITASVMMVIENNNSPEYTNSLGGIWCTYDDRDSGGDSVVWPPSSTGDKNNFVKSKPGYGGGGYAIRITGTAGTQLGHDFIGVLTFLSSKSSCPDCVGVDISVYKGVRFKIKGSITKGKFAFILPYEASEANRERNTCVSLTSYADYESDITSQVGSDWRTVTLKFRKDLKQPEWTKSDEHYDIEKVLSDARVIKWQYTGGNGAPVDIWIDELVFY